MTEAAPAVTIKRPLEVAGVVADIPDRRISAKTCRKFNVTVEYSSDGSISKHHYPYYSTDTDDVKGSKVRLVQNKNFFATGTLQGTGLFGQQTCRGKGKYITITEGELDALSVSEIFENKWDVVSLRSGASSAAKEIKEQLEWLEGYENVVLCFDGDKAGQAAIDEVKDVFSPGKLKICKLPLKDASEMLQSGKVREFVSAWWDAKPYQPDGIVSGNDTWEAITGKMKVKSIAYPWQGLNDMTKGFRPYELVSRIRYMAKALDCKWIVLDHLSIVVSAQDNGDERKAIDGIMTKLRALVQETGVGLFLVSHLRRTQGKPHEDGGRISLGELRGSQAIAQLSDMGIGLERNQQHEDPEIRNTTTVRILKNRYAGLTGAACWLKYDNFTGRMSQTSKPKEHDNDL